jgi:alkylation response protein AidB-like acyl-CoA dehydrogenase
MLGSGGEGRFPRGKSGRVVINMAVDFELSSEQLELQANAHAFAESQLSKVGEHLDTVDDPAEAFYATRDAYRAMAEAGFTKSFIPTDYGGSGFGMIDFAIAAEELTRFDVNVPTTLLGSGLGLQPVIQFGTHEQKERFLRPFADDPDGSLLASYAFTEVTGGANFDSDDPEAGVRTIAHRDGDEWVITGEKHWTTNGTGWDGNGAHLYSVVCRTDSTKPARESLAVIMVPGDAPGVNVVDVYDKIGHRGVVGPRVHLDEVRVPSDNLIGKPGQQGIKIISGAFSWTAALIGAACVGVMRSAFETALEFAKTERRLGSVPIIEHQNVGYMLADIKMRIEAARYLTWKACHYFDQTNGRGEELPIITKVYCSELAFQTVYDAMRVVGIESYAKNQLPLERLLRDALVFPLYDGGNAGVRRRQLHGIIAAESYDPMAGVQGKVSAWAD